jgi:hypothetical protein
MNSTVDIAKTAGNIISEYYADAFEVLEDLDTQEVGDKLDFVKNYVDNCIHVFDRLTFQNSDASEYEDDDDSLEELEENNEEAAVSEENEDEVVARPPRLTPFSSVDGSFGFIH